MGEIMFASALQDLTNRQSVPDMIHYFFDNDTLKALLYNCLRVDIPDNNIKAEVVSKILGDSFTDIGTGTNRISFFKNGLCIKIALDRRGLVDNYQEYKRSLELPQYLAKTYETNYLINICEYVIVLNQSEFQDYREQICEVLYNISQGYLFDDVGFTMKNSYNWGKREAVLSMDEKFELGLEEDEVVYDIVILDYGYLYPLQGQSKKLLTCPKCGNRLMWDQNYTKLVCASPVCNTTLTPTQIRNMMNLNFEEQENKLISSLTNTKMPDLTKVEQMLSSIKKEG